MIHSVEIVFLFMSFKRLWLEPEQIKQILLDLEQLTSDTSFTLGGPASDKIAMSLRAASQILNNTKDFFESLKYNLRI